MQRDISENIDRSKSFKIVIFLLGFVILTFFICHYFLYKDIKTRNEHASLLEHELSLEEGKQEYLSLTDRLLQNIQSDIDNINNSIIPADGDIHFIEDLEILAKNNGLKIDIDSLIIEEDSSLSSSKATTLKIKAKTSGPWSGTYAFLANLESLPIKIKLNGFSLAAAQSDTGDGKKSSASIWQSSFEIVLLKYK